MEKKKGLETLQALLYLVGCAVNGIVPEKERVQAMDLDAVFSLSERQSLLTLACYAVASACGGSLPKDGNLSAWDINNQILTYRAQLMNEDLKRLLSYLESNGIWYMPMKGAVLQDMYPTPETRQKTDYDILFDNNHQHKVLQWFVDNGYEVEAYGTMLHDKYIKKPFFCFEMHRALLWYSPGTKWAEYYDNVETRLIPDSDTSYRRHFSDEDLYIHVVTHGYRHHIYAGIGIRFLLDCYLLVKNNGKSMDWDYVDKELALIGITDFEKNVRHLCKALFASPETFTLSTLTQQEMDFFESFVIAGTHGSSEILVRNRVQNNSTKQKLKYAWSRLFPNREFMIYNYPFFRRHIWLLPAGYIYRLFYRIKVNHKHLASEIKALKKF